MPSGDNPAELGGGVKVPYEVAYALAILGEYIDDERKELSKLEGKPQADPVNAILASSALTFLKIDIGRIAADRAKREETERARAELQAELRGIDGKYELHKELRAIDATHGLTGHPKPYYANYKAEEARNAQIASWQLKQELRTIDNQYKTRAELQAELRGIDGKYELHKELRTIDNQYKTRAELQAELRGIDGKYELHKELRAIDYKYEPRIYLQRARSAVAAAYRSQCELAVELGADHAAVKTVRACCKLTRALVNVYNAVHALTTLTQPEIVVGDNAHATGLADQALFHVLEALFHLNDYQERWVEDRSADVSGVFAAMAGAVMGDPSTFMTGVLTTPAQQAQGATR